MYIFTWFDSRLPECVYSFAICDCCCCFFLYFFFFFILLSGYSIYVSSIFSGITHWTRIYVSNKYVFFLFFVPKIKWRINNCPFSFQLEIECNFYVCDQHNEQINKNWNKQNDKKSTENWISKALYRQDIPCVWTKLFLVLFILW